ncbi:MULTISPECIES: TRAP transporter large permease [Halomonadaceae]|jgi:C4-dicarboxylate transporter DctM subunit|uniref:TRAP transporter large permease protein n=1 Tax=Vreelandella aquamarina TaxID=77097 RepID=A0A1N6DPX0_9GAMM|nr:MULTISPECIES: TRAP transporter large permease [Halomonas]HAO02109.1 TRAP transporter large permease [Halomonas sp.]MCO7244419.1 TRAP transporter large permease [Halomonas sp. Ps84H-12]SIN63913.1 C4-dicarboxylate transporter, DctM subunit [Halomonas meridiana]SIN72835.1 C4-dicarboxylate transporter, DctM subunit [Halomonas meridiana]SIO41511.1 C4-dicarboxylate transporter, DctM subunit [Halomonas meridiana]|tara:strand:- start:1968 stop:3245 length:1278 start_codon:yes stop_codon:yes gene_type:complete
MITALLPIFFAVLLLGLPIFAALAFSVILAIQFFGNTDPVIVPMRMFSGMNNFSLMAIPFFILAAELMRIGGLSERLIDLAKALVGWVPGGLAAATVLSCLFFGSISGSSPATVVAIGSIMFPALVAAGYDKRFAIGVIATAGTLGPIVPPSIALIIYGSVTGTSVGRLFAAGLLPAILIASLLIAYCIVYASFKGYGRSTFPSLREIGSALKAAAWGLGLPFILLGGIYSGVFTPTESAAVACMYGLFVGMVVYRKIDLKNLLSTLSSAGLMSASLLLITAGASAFSWLLAITGAPTQLAGEVLSWTDDPIQVMALFNVVMIVAGFFLDSASAIIVLSPLLQPIAAQVGVDSTHFGVITLINFSVGMITPPVGLNLFVAMAISRMTLPEVFKACLPLIGLMLLSLVIITYVPWFSTYLPELIYR